MTISFRWGIPILDEGFVQIPNTFLDHYSEIGVDRQEFLLILHLARYKYEKEGSESRPALATIAEQMGCSHRMVQRWVSSLKQKGFLRVEEKFGKDGKQLPNVYNFEGFSRASLGHDIPGGEDDTDVLGMVTRESYEEEENKKNSSVRARSA